jgi:hypothetical protein
LTHLVAFAKLDLGGVAMTTTTVLTVESVLDSVNQLPEPGQREIAVNLLKRFNSKTILALLREVEPLDEPAYDYEDPGPITDEETNFIAAQGFLRKDEEEAAYETTSSR